MKERMKDTNLDRETEEAAPGLMLGFFIPSAPSTYTCSFSKCIFLPQLSIAAANELDFQLASIGKLEL